MTTRKTSLLRAMSLTGLAATAILTFTGCQILFALAAKLFPKEKVQPMFVLPANKTILVFPDDMKCPLVYPPVKRTMSERADELIIEHSLAADTIPYDKLIDLHNAEPDFNLMSVPKIGRRLGADLVIYVLIEEFSLKDNSVDTLWRGKLVAKVKVVDVLKGRIWPDESGGFSITVVEPITDNSSMDYGSQLSRKLAGRMAEKAIGLFHAHYIDRARPKEEATDMSVPIQ